MSYIAHYPTLPPEIWNQVIGEVPRPQLPKLLGLCCLFHDIVTRILFSAIKIYFIEGHLGFDMLNTHHSDWTEEVAMKLVCKSWEILNHICQEPRFARIVKSLTIIAFADGQSIFERLSLSNALLFMPNLQTFRWIGVGPPLDEIVAECIPPNLKNLVVQSAFPLKFLGHLNNITALHLPMPFFFPDDEEAHDRLVVYDEPLFSPHLSVGETIEIMAPNLQSLRITATQVRDIPIRVFTTLKDLEILGTVGDQEELVGLDVVFRHATSLEDLTLVGLFSSEVLSFLPDYSIKPLPLLTSFRLSCEELDYFPMREDEFQALCGFLHHRISLRRLYIRLPAIQWNETSRLLSICRELSGIEVLGLHMGNDVLSEFHEIETLVASLSPKLHALHIAMNWGSGNILPLVEAIAKLPRLKFLHLYGVVVRLPILLEDIAVDASGLDMIGLNRALWTIERVGSEIITSKYPRWKIKFCIEEDFLCADDAWLFKYN